jgi:hypothetical protein
MMSPTASSVKTASTLLRWAGWIRRQEQSDESVEVCHVENVVPVDIRTPESGAARICCRKHRIHEVADVQAVDQTVMVDITAAAA